MFRDMEPDVFEEQWEPTDEDIYGRTDDFMKRLLAQIKENGMVSTAPNGAYA